MQDTRQLAAVLFADIMGYTAMMQSDEQSALEALQRFESALRKYVGHHGGEIVQFYGDGCLTTFSTTINAINCAKELQLAFGNSVPVRIGIHFGDIVFKDDNAFGDAVNIASRIESMGVPGSVLFSEPVYEAIRNKQLEAVSLGSYTFKNIARPMEVYALKHEGLAIPNRSQVKGKFASAPKRKPVLAIIAIGLIIAIGAYMWATRSIHSSQNATEHVVKATSLAIFPFEHIQDGEDLKYLSDGIPENLINRLSSLPGLNVFSRNATFSLRDTMSDMHYVSDLLKADAVLTGQLSKVDEYLVINCQLTDAHTDKQIWGTKITQKVQELFELEDSLVTVLLHPLRVQLQLGHEPVVEQKKEIPAEAYAHYMQGRYLSYGSTREETERALDHFRKAIEIDRSYAEAYAAIANEKIIQAMFSTASREAIFAEAQTAAQSAIALDSTLSLPYLTLAAIDFYGNYDWKGADEKYLKALRMDPDDPTAMIRYSAYLAAMRRHPEAISLAQQAARKDPVSISSLHNLGWVNYLARDYHASKSAFAKALELHPDWLWGFVKKGYAHHQLGECDTAIALANRGLDILGEWGSEILQTAFTSTLIRCDAENAGERNTAFFRHIDQHGYEDPFVLMMIHYASKDYEKAITWAEKTVEERSPSVYLLIIDSFWDPEFYNLPEYQALLRRLNV